MNVIRLEHLSKTFGRGARSMRAIQNLNLEVGPEQVFGFLGPNGAGKTTTIRVLMDLIRPTQGAAYIYGRDVRRDAGVLKRVGALVEGAAFYAYLSGRDNLEVLARTAGDYHPARIRSLLEQVGMADRAQRAVGSYSTGMKQRLGIAAALLSDPDLVILDEPTNGLDPAGIQEMRAFIRNLAHRQGKTVFLSSHLLNEVEQICDRVAIIHRGEIVREGSVAELLSQGAVEVHVQASPAERAREVLQESWAVAHDGAETEEALAWLVVSASPDETPRLVELLVAHGISVHQVAIRRPTLEEYFMDATHVAPPAGEKLESADG